MNKTRKARTVLSIILAFILSLTLTALSVAVAADVTVLSSEYAANSIGKSGFVGTVREDIHKEFLSYGNACNIGDDFFEKFFNDTLTEDFVDTDAITYAVLVYSYPKAQVDTTRLKEALKPALYDYAVEMGYGDQPNLDEDLNLIVKELSEIYSSHLSLPSASTIHTYLARAEKYIGAGIIALAAFAVLCAVVILLSYKPKIEPFMYLTCASAGAFLMTLALPLYLRVTNTIGKVNITSKAMYSLVVTYGNGVLNAVLLSAAALAALTALFAVLYTLRARKN